MSTPVLDLLASDYPDFEWELHEPIGDPVRIQGIARGGWPRFKINLSSELEDKWHAKTGLIFRDGKCLTSKTSSREFSYAINEGIEECLEHSSFSLSSKSDHETMINERCLNTLQKHFPSVDWEVEDVNEAYE